MLDLKDKVACVTGAGSVGDDPNAKIWGNGKATSVLLARQGVVMSFADVFLILTWLFLAFAVSAVLMTRPKPDTGTAGH